MIASIVRAYVRHYSDSGQSIAYVEWLDTKGKSGTTGGNPDNPHMVALFDRAIREGLTIETETW
jgi:hypothetical protein